MNVKLFTAARVDLKLDAIDESAKEWTQRFRLTQSVSRSVQYLRQRRCPDAQEEGVEIEYGAYRVTALKFEVETEVRACSITALGGLESANADAALAEYCRRERLFLGFQMTPNGEVVEELPRSADQITARPGFGGRQEASLRGLGRAFAPWLRNRSSACLKR